MNCNPQLIVDFFTRKKTIDDFSHQNFCVENVYFLKTLVFFLEIADCGHCQKDGVQTGRCLEPNECM